MLYWLMNMGFAGGDGEVDDVTVPDQITHVSHITDMTWLTTFLLALFRST